MGVKKYKAQFSSFSKEHTVRFDFVYQNYINRLKNEEKISFLDLFEIVENNKPDISSLSDFRYCQIGDVSKDGIANPVYLNFSDRKEDFESYYKKIEKGDILAVEENDILLSFLLPQDLSIKGKFFRVSKDAKDIYFTNAFIQLRPKFCPLLLYYCLKSIFYDDLVSVARIRMGYTGYATLELPDLKKLMLPKSSIDLLRQNETKIVERINALESEIEKLKSTKIPDTDIINKVLGEELGIDWAKFEKLKKIRQYTARLSDFSKNTDCRMSYKFHNKAQKYLWDFMLAKTDKRIKDFIEEPIILGESVSPDCYEEDGEYYYIAMSNIKTWNFEPEDCKKVNKSYSDTALKKGKSIQKNDIILARSGEGTIGKVALITDDINAIFADFTQRIRLKNYNPICAYYYFRSDIFQYFIYSHKKGMGNNTNIFPNQVQEFPMPDWSIEKQSHIAAKIKAQLDAQKQIDIQIQQKQQEILDIVENAVR